MMKKTLCILVCILTVAVSIFGVSAIEKTNEITCENTTVIFEDDSVWDQQTKELIAEKLVYGENTASTYGLWCTLFGHSYTVEGVTTIRHCVYDSDPRCVSELYEVSVCSRCNDTQSNLLSKSLVSCCPEE